VITSSRTDCPESWRMWEREWKRSRLLGFHWKTSVDQDSSTSATFPGTVKLILYTLHNAYSLTQILRLICALAVCVCMCIWHCECYPSSWIAHITLKDIDWQVCKCLVSGRMPPNPPPALPPTMGSAPGPRETLPWDSRHPHWQLLL